ncbi:MAG: hypothetical protein ABI629_16820 [bacterium]
MTRISVRVWRIVAGAPQWLFTYAGAIDDAVLRAVMQHVRCLTTAVPGEWTVEVIGADLHGGLLHSVQNDLGDLRRSGLRPRLAHAPYLRPELSAALTALVIAASPSQMLH